MFYGNSLSISWYLSLTIATKYFISIIRILNQYEEAKHLFELTLKYGKIDIMIYFYIRDCYIKLDDENKAMEYEAYGIMLDKYSEYINLVVKSIMKKLFHT